MEEPIEMMNSLIRPPPSMETPGDRTGNTNREELSEVEKKVSEERREI